MVSQRAPFGAYKKKEGPLKVILNISLPRMTFKRRQEIEGATLDIFSYKQDSEKHPTKGRRQIQHYNPPDMCGLMDVTAQRKPQQTIPMGN